MLFRDILLKRKCGLTDNPGAEDKCLYCTCSVEAIYIENTIIAKVLKYKCNIPDNRYSASRIHYRMCMYTSRSRFHFIINVMVEGKPEIDKSSYPGVVPDILIDTMYSGCTYCMLQNPGIGNILSN